LNNNLNINIEKEDHNLNDYLYCWNIFKERPNRINIFDNFDTKKFEDFIISKNIEVDSTFSDVAPSSNGDYVVNERKLLKYEDYIFISYVLVDKFSTLEESMITDVSVIFSSSIPINKINDIVDSLNKFALSMDENEEVVDQSNLSVVTYTPNGLGTLPMSVLNYDYDNIEHYYNDVTIKEIEKLIKFFKKSTKSLNLIVGERGNGKTTLLNYICTQVKKNVLFIPLNLIESTINNPDFRNFIVGKSNTILIIEDLDNYLINSKSSYFVNNLLQLVDGFHSDNLCLNIICSVNTDCIDEVDENILACNNLGRTILVDRLDVDKIDDLCKHIGQKNKFKSPQRVVDVLKNNKKSNSIVEIGFN